MLERKIQHKINGDNAGMRVDVFLAARFPYHSRYQWQKEIKSGRILVNMRECKPSKKLLEGDIISYHPAKKEPPIEKRYEIIYEDEYLLAINKPGLLPCHPAGPYFKNTLWALLSEKYSEVHFVNRLDRETSGLILVAKSGKIKSLLTNPKHNFIKDKKYLCIVFGEFPENPLIATGFLWNRGSLHKNSKLTNTVTKKRFFSEILPENAENSEHAVTRFKKIKSWTYGSKTLSLIQAKLETGKMHQIRATLCSLGYPVVGDKLYGPDESIFIRFVNNEMTARDKKVLLMPTQALHSFQISMIHPVTLKNIILEAPLPWSDILYPSLNSGM